MDKDIGDTIRMTNMLALLASMEEELASRRRVIHDIKKLDAIENPKTNRDKTIS